MLTIKNTAEVTRYMRKFAQQFEQALIYQLEYAVEDLVNYAKKTGAYKDQTSNLRSSIGGVVLRDGKPVQYKGFTGRVEGTGTGMEYINSLIKNYGTGYVLLIVAGMEYAEYVEYLYGKNVLIKAELRMTKTVPRMLNKLKRKMDELR